jgi:ATP-dependent metalloprotease
MSMLIYFCKTSLLPENDRTSISLKEYLAGIDVSMGGRVAEELSESGNIHVDQQSDNIFAFPVYGAENVTSGASSDIKNATRTAQAMVKVSNTLLKSRDRFYTCLPA